MHGLANFLNGNEKLKCKLLVENLRPATLRDQIKHFQELDATSRISVSQLFDVVNSEAFKN